MAASPYLPRINRAAPNCRERTATDSDFDYPPSRQRRRSGRRLKKCRTWATGRAPVLVVEVVGVLHPLAQGPLRTCEKVRGSKEHLETKAHPEAASAPLPRLIFRPPDAGARLPCCARAIADMTMAQEQKADQT